MGVLADVRTVSSQARSTNYVCLLSNAQFVCAGTRCVATTLLAHFPKISSRRMTRALPPILFQQVYKTKRAYATHSRLVRDLSLSLVFFSPLPLPSKRNGLRVKVRPSVAVFPNKYPGHASGSIDQALLSEHFFSWVDGATLNRRIVAFARRTMASERVDENNGT